MNTVVGRNTGLKDFFCLKKRLGSLSAYVIFVAFCQLLCGLASATSVNQLSPGKTVQGILDFAGRQYILPRGQWVTAYRDIRTGVRGRNADSATIILTQTRDKQLTAMVRLVVEYSLLELDLTDASLCDSVRLATTFQEKSRISVSTTDCLRTSAFSGGPDDYVRGPWGHAKLWLQDNQIVTPALGMVAEYDYRSLNESIEYTVWQPVWDDARRVSDDKVAAFKAWSLQFREVQRERAVGLGAPKVSEVKP